MRRTAGRWARLLGGPAILAVLVWRLGTGPFLDAVAMIDGRSLAAAAAIAVLTTVCSAWRWSLVARGLGLGLQLRPAVAAYYRSQFLNTTLPGGVVGDVDRGVRHGRGLGHTSLGLRAVAWERLAGQVVQIALAMTVLLLLPSPVRSSMPAVVIAVAAGALGLVLLGWALPHAGPSVWARTVRTVVADLRGGLRTWRAFTGIVLASVAVVAGHTVTFLIAARTAGVTASPVTMLPLALLIMLAMGVPMNIAGWGPREGAAAWVFGAAGLGEAQGVATAVVFGVMVLVSSLPGAVVLIAARLHPGAPDRGQADSPPTWVPSPAELKGGVAGG